jgi:hypothetical protein
MQPRLAVLSCLLVMAGGCSNSSQPAFEPTATVREIMNSIVDPSSDVLWDSVEVEATLAGTRKKAPGSDAEWNVLRQNAIALVEASNLLLIPGRRIAAPGDKAEDPRADRNPEEIQLLMTQDPASWTRFAHGLHDAAMESLNAIRAKDVQQLLNAGDVLDRACERCHEVYWYRVAPGRAGSR